MSGWHDYRRTRQSRNATLAVWDRRTYCPYHIMQQPVSSKLIRLLGQICRGEATLKKYHYEDLPPIEVSGVDRSESRKMSGDQGSCHEEVRVDAGPSRNQGEIGAMVAGDQRQGQAGEIQTLGPVSNKLADSEIVGAVG